MSRKTTLSRRTVLAGIATAGVASGLGSRNSFAQSGTEVSYNTFLDPANADDPRSSPPSTYDEVAALGARLSKDNITGYAIPLGVTGGIGGAQAFVEFVLSSMLAGNTGALFAPDGRNIGFSDERLLLAATTVRDLFAK